MSKFIFGLVTYETHLVVGSELMNSDLVIAMMGLLGVVCVLFVFAIVFGKQPPKSTSQATVKPQAQTISEPSPMQLAIHRDNELAIHRDNEPVGNNKVLKGCLIGFLVVILIGFVVLAVVLRQIGQAIDGFFEGVRDFFEHPLNPFSWF